MCDLSCLKYSDYRDVYEPNEDSYLLIDALNLESRDYISKLAKENDGVCFPKKIIEIGVGSGAIINSLQMLMKRDCEASLVNGCKFIGTDINPKAIDCAKRLTELNKTSIEFFLEEGLDMSYLK